MSRAGLTPSQTVGPYFSIGLAHARAPCLIGAGCSQTPLQLGGQVFDAAQQPVADALLEIWQADADGRYAPDCASGFRGAGRAACNASGEYCFTTVKPGPPCVEGVSQAPHVNVMLFARGLLVHLYTRVYFADEAARNASDTVLAAVPAARRETLLAVMQDGEYRFDIHLGGERETVFFDV